MGDLFGDEVVVHIANDGDHFQEDQTNSELDE
jgi:hypothetical protein